jgi:hypothetical protein
MATEEEIGELIDQVLKEKARDAGATNSDGDI